MKDKKKDEKTYLKNPPNFSEIKKSDTDKDNTEKEGRKERREKKNEKIDKRKMVLK